MPGPGKRLSGGPRSGGVALGAAVAASFLAGCGTAGGGDEAEGAPPLALGESRAGSVAPFVQCRDWNAGTVEQRLATIEDIREQVSAEGATADSPPMPDDEAYDLFERACAKEFAAGFRLYKLYTRAVAFDDILGE